MLGKQEFDDQKIHCSKNLFRLFNLEINFKAKFALQCIFELNSLFNTYMKKIRSSTDF